MSKKDEKQFAYLLYMETDLSQKEIARRSKVSEKTLSGWISREEWTVQKAANTVTRKQQVVNYLMQLKELNDTIIGRDKGKRYATSAESDTINKITKAIETLEKNVTLSDYIMVTEDFMKFAMSIDQQQAKILLPLVNEFIQARAKELVK